MSDNLVLGKKNVKAMILVVLLVICLFASITYVFHLMFNYSSPRDVFFGVSFGLNTTAEAKLLIDKVKDYTNLFVINSWAISTNETALNEICNYAVEAELHFMVFFSFVSHFTYSWHIPWLEAAKERWGEYFLGIYLYDEPGGKQIDKDHWRGSGSPQGSFSNYSEAANWFISEINNSISMQDLRVRNIPVFTSDYALYWFDYLAGYDCVFAEFGWNHSRIKHIALVRGAANVQGKEWGVIITWAYNHPPYLENGTKLLEDLILAYRAGANYIVIFNYPKINPYGILTEEHFEAMRKFWRLINSGSPIAKIKADIAFVLPRDYGWGMRTPDDNIWGYWPPDDLAPRIWRETNELMETYGLKLDIIYDDSRFNYKRKYSKIYFWNCS